MIKFEQISEQEVLIIYERFTAIDPEKQTRILHAAYREFAQNGYKKASTNRIVKKAGIGKGMLFYYFNSKLDLYLFLLDYGAVFFENYFDTLAKRQKDFDYIEKYRVASQCKLEAYLKNPYIFEFFTRLYFNEEDTSITVEVKKRYDDIISIRDKIFIFLGTNHDTFRFRTDIDIDKLMKYVTWCLDGYTQELLGKFQGQNLSDINLAPYWTEFDEILDDLKTIFYKSCKSGGHEYVNG